MLLTARTFILCSALALSFALPVVADDDQDTVNGPAKQPVTSTKFGTCVRTKWSSPSDPCAPAAPAPKVEVTPQPQPVMQLEREQLTIYFPFNKATITAESAGKLDAIAGAVNQSPKVTRVDIVGYTDEIGSNSYNEKLSIKRANAAKKYLDNKMQIPVGVLGLRGMGKDHPIVNCKRVRKRAEKISCMARDRRVEIEFEFEK